MRNIAIACAANVVPGTQAASAATEPGSAFFCKSIVSVDDSKHTVTLPLHSGLAKGETVWYIVTDASVARKQGVD